MCYHSSDSDKMNFSFTKEAVTLEDIQVIHPAETAQTTFAHLTSYVSFTQCNFALKRKKKTVDFIFHCMNLFDNKSSFQEVMKRRAYYGSDFCVQQWQRAT